MSRIAYYRGFATEEIPMFTQEQIEQMSPEQLVAALNQARQENEVLRTEVAAKQDRALSFKVSEKGGLSVYGLGRFPVTLYGNQWKKLLAVAKDIATFIDKNQGQGPGKISMIKPVDHKTAQPQ